LKSQHLVVAVVLVRGISRAEPLVIFRATLRTGLSLSRSRALILLLVACAAAAFVWVRSISEEAAIERRLDALAAEINLSTTDGIGLLARSAQLGTFFTDDVVIELGRGSAAIRSRATVMDMASRLQPRTSAFTLRLTDVGVALAPDRISASVVLTAEFIRRGGGEDAIDARELSIEMTKADGSWRIAHLAVVEAFK
jgi:SnoaL-like domain